MSTKKAKPPQPEAPPVAFNIRSVTAADVAALDRAVARREKTAPAGARFSRGSVLLAVIRDALAAEDAADGAAPVEAKP